jgi:hypothetical protein
MTVADLIDRLATLPPRHEVWVDSGDFATSPGRLIASPAAA